MVTATQRIVIRDRWTGTRGHIDEMLPEDWDEAKQVCEQGKPRIPRLSPEGVLKLWDFLERERPDQAAAVILDFVDNG